MTWYPTDTGVYIQHFLSLVVFRSCYCQQHMHREEPWRRRLCGLFRWIVSLITTHRWIVCCCFLHSGLLSAVMSRTEADSQLTGIR
jgi:hypothetical protein